MLYNYLKICLRNIRRHKLFSIINIFGLALSLTICIAVLMIIKHQFEIDNFHPYPDRTYRIITKITYDSGRKAEYASSPFQLGIRLEENYGFVENTVTFYRGIYGDAVANEKKLNIRGSFTEPSFFNIFGFELEYGNPETALQKPYSIILSQETAHRFYGAKNPLGETFKIEGIGNFTVTGLLKSKLEDTHLKYGVLASLSTLPLLQQNEDYQWDLKHWDHAVNSSYTYVLLEQGAQSQILKSNLHVLAQRIKKNYELGSLVDAYNFSVQTLDAIAPSNGDLSFAIEDGKVRSMGQLLFLLGVAFIVLLMACFNYTNLSIARALKRAKEVGMYKVWGAKRSQIIVPSVLQATLISLASLIIAYALLPFIPLPANIIQEMHITEFDWMLMLYLLLFAIFTGLMAGALPAWLLSSLKPVETLKNIKNIELIEGLKLRKALVVAQFVISLVLIIATVTIFRQSQFAATAEYGFRKENVINLRLQNVDYKLLKNELSNITGVKQISAASRRFGLFAVGTDVKKSKSSASVDTDIYFTDRNIVETMDLTLLAGSTFPESIKKDYGRHIVVNQQFLKLFNWESPAEAVGQTVWLFDSTEVQIAGVVKDFHYQTLSFPIDPLILWSYPSRFNYLNIYIASNHMDEVILKIKKVWNDIVPMQPISYISTKDYLYRAHGYKQMNSSLAFYAFIAISLACLGLLGMVTYTVEERTREVGIRKVLGASVGKVIFLLSREFLWLLGLAALIGLPAGYWLGYQFLNSYAYHINLGFGILSFGLGILLLTGLSAIGFQIWRVANTNPVDTLRVEH